MIREDKEYTHLEEEEELYDTLDKLKRLDKIASNNIITKLETLYRQYGYDEYGWKMNNWHNGKLMNNLQELRSKLKSLNNLAESAELQAKLNLKERNKIQMRAKEAELEESNYEDQLDNNKINRKKKSTKPKPKRKITKKCKCK